MDEIIFPCPVFSAGFANPGLILGLRPANERRRYKVAPSLIGWAQCPVSSAGFANPGLIPGCP